MRKFAVALAVLASLTSSAVAAEGPLMVRLRGVYVLPADKSDAIGALGVPADKISVQKKLIPELDFTYFFLLPNLSAELILTYPQKHDVKVNYAGIGKVGTITELPPCLTLQWHFLPGAVANPYVGAGLNLTLITAQDLGGPKLDTTSIGFVGQAGVDVQVAKQVYINADVKYVTMSFPLKSSGVKLTTVTVSPWLFGLGVGYRF